MGLIPIDVTRFWVFWTAAEIDFRAEFLQILASAGAGRPMEIHTTACDRVSFSKSVKISDNHWESLHPHVIMFAFRNYCKSMKFIATYCARIVP